MKPESDGEPPILTDLPSGMTFVVGPGHHLQETDGTAVVAFAPNAFAHVDVFSKTGLVPCDGAEKHTGCFASRGSTEERRLVFIHDDCADVLGDRLVTRLGIGKRLTHVAPQLNARMKQVDHDRKDDGFQHGISRPPNFEVLVAKRNGLGPDRTFPDSSVVIRASALSKRCTDWTVRSAGALATQGLLR